MKSNKLGILLLRHSLMTCTYTTWVFITCDRFNMLVLIADDCGAKCAYIMLWEQIYSAID